MAGRKSGANVFELANRASLNKNTGSLDGLTNRVSNHESSTNLNAHQISNVDGLQSALDGKQNIISGHSGTLTIVTSVDFGNSTFETAQLNIINGIITEIN